MGSLQLVASITLSRSSDNDFLSLINDPNATSWVAVSKGGKLMKPGDAVKPAD